MSSRPLVSVYITTHKRVDLLPRAINSVLAQNYRPIEIIVVDDASKDSTIDLLKKYEQQLSGERDLTFGYLEHSENKGACAARNYAIRTAKGQFITGLDDDDEFFPSRIKQMVENWDDKYSALCSSIEVDDGGGKISYLDREIGEISLDNLLKRNVIGSQIFTKTAYLRAIEGFDITFPAWQDYECWIRIIDRFGPVLKLKEPSYRFHRGHDKPRITSDNRSLEAIKLIIKKHGHRLNPHQKRRLKYKELTAEKLSYRNLRDWLPAMTLRTAPRILKKWVKTNCL